MIATCVERNVSQLFIELCTYTDESNVSAQMYAAAANQTVLSLRSEAASLAFFLGCFSIVVISGNKAKQLSGPPPSDFATAPPLSLSLSPR